jgi:hypothetical protein
MVKLPQKSESQKFAQQRDAMTKNKSLNQKIEAYQKAYLVFAESIQNGCFSLLPKVLHASGCCLSLRSRFGGSTT